MTQITQVITPLGTSPSRDDPDHFDDNMDYLLGQLPTMVTQQNTFGTQLNTVAGEVNANLTTATAQAGIATTKAAEAAASANSAASAAGNNKWVAGTTYVDGYVVWSPSDYKAYRKVGAGVSNVDPGVNPAGWTNPVTIPVVTGLVPIGGLVAFDSDVTANTVTGSNGDVYLKTGVIADASVYPNAPSAPWATISSQAPVPGVTNMRSLAYGAGIWVAGDNLGGRWTSTDGFNWTNRGTLAGFGGTGTVRIIYANAYFVAIDGANAVCARSADGLTWTYVALPSSGWGDSALAYGNGTFVLAKANSTAIATSPDGLTWTARTNSRSFTGYNGQRGNALAYGNGLFILVDQDGIAGSLSTSPDGVTWTTRTVTAPQTNWTNIAFGNGIFVAAINDGTYTHLTSTDGITWTGRNGGIAGSTVGFVGGKFVMTSSTSSYTSTDGIAWTTTTANGCSANNASYYASNGTMHLASSNSTYVTFSYDVTHWQSVFGNALQSTRQIAYGNGKFIAVQAGGVSVQMSVDGINWYSCAIADANFFGCAYFNGMFIVIGASNYWTSSDGFVWTSRTAPTSKSSILSVANGKIFSQNATASYSYSSDGINWFNTSVFPASLTWKAVLYGNNTYVAYDGTSGLATSTDGLTWTMRIVPSTSIAQIIFASGFFIAYSASGNSFYMSADGIAWTLMTIGYGGALSIVTMVTDGTRVYALAVSSAPNGILVWPGTGSSFYRRIMPTYVSASTPFSAAINPSGLFVSRDATATSYYGTISATNKVLNDTNLKTYNATTSEQTNFYKRVA